MLFPALILALMAVQNVQAQDLRYPELERPYQQRVERQSGSQAQRAPRQRQVVPAQQPGRPFVRLPFVDKILPRLDAPPPRWPTGRQSPVQSRTTRQPPANTEIPAASGTPAQNAQPSLRTPAPRKAAPPPPSTTIGVIGNSFAQDLAQGLTQVFSDQPDIALVRSIRSGKGLAADDVRPWVDMAKQAASRKPMHALVFFMSAFETDIQQEKGLADDPAQVAQLYSIRMEEILRAVQDKDIPVIWVGLPPVENEELSNDHAFINGYVRQKVGAWKGIFVDVWEPFLDAEGHFSFDGADVDGETARLRTQDGIHFTRAGRRKIAYYVAADIRQALMHSGKTQVKLDDLPELKADVTRASSHKEGTSRILLLSEPNISSGGNLVLHTPTNHAPSLMSPETPPTPAPEGRADNYVWRDSSSLDTRTPLR